MANLQPHTYEGEPGSPYCAICQLPHSNRIHAANRKRKRVVVNLDVPQDYSDNDTRRHVAEVLGAEVSLVVTEVTVIP